MERLNKILARAGVASRRGADRLIEAGRVTVNGTIVAELGARVDLRNDAIKVDGKRLPAAPERHTYLMLHKPRGYLTTMSDPEGRPTIKEFLKRSRGRLFPVGRLDFNTEGLLLLTDDGELARDLMDPQNKVEKLYRAKVRGCPGEVALNRLRGGVTLEGRKSRPARARLAQPGNNAWVEIAVVEGRKHQVRRMLEAVGHPVVKLRRISYGGIPLGRLEVGALRPLTADELTRLRRAIRGPSRQGSDSA
jgi:pseudouridine synthase